ncbi:hypothetical protein JHK87_005084 [Glycine soja]|nr:hypothetical protein JHK87_005084 [Glycine soja]
MSSKLQPSQSCNFLDEVSSMKELASHGLLYTLSQSCKEYNDVVSVLAPNIPAMYEMHFAVPMAGAVLNTINTRLDANNIATILRHSEAKVLFVDYEYVPKAKEALELLIAKKYHSSPPLLILIDDINSPTSIQFVELEYEQLVYNDDSNFFPEKIHDEWAPIALNYTSGTTSASKGVVYSHREAKPSERFEIKSIVEILTGGAPSPPSLIEKIESLGFHEEYATLHGSQGGEVCGGIAKNFNW